MCGRLRRRRTICARPQRRNIGRNESRERADEEFSGAGVQTVVGAGGIRAREEQHGHEQGGCEGQARHDPERRIAHPAQGQQDKRPDQVKLSQDPQVPQVCERGGQAGRREIRDLAENIDPVAREKRGREGVGLDFREEAGRDEVAEERSPRDGDENRGPQAQEATAQVAPVGEAAFAAQLAQHAAGDEEAGQHEEHRDAHETAGEQRRAHVIEHHRDDRERADAVQGADAGGAGCRLLGSCRWCGPPRRLRGSARRRGARGGQRRRCGA